MRRLVHPHSYFASCGSNSVGPAFPMSLGVKSSQLVSSTVPTATVCITTTTCFQSNFGASLTQRRALLTTSMTRLVQYQQTCETNRAIETGDKKTALKWMTKSSREFLTENDKVRASSNPQRNEQNAQLAVEKKISAAHAIRNEREFQKELDMLYDTKSRRFFKTFDFFRRQGMFFFLSYVAVYVFCFASFYYILANEIVSKHSIFEMLFVMSNGAFDRDTFIKRLESWDTYINFGFAFILNEMLEVVRFPMVMAFFLTFRGTFSRLGRTMKKSMYRRSAPEI